MLRTAWCNGVAALLGAIAVLLCYAPPVGAMEILGQAGVLGEWELTGHLTESAPGAPRQFSGPLKMKHVGICTQDGPDERAGEIRLQLTGADSQVTAELVLDGAPCTYSARKAHNYEGTLSCEGRAPVPLLVWLKQLDRQAAGRARRSHSFRSMRPRRASPNGTSECCSTRPPQ